MLRRLPEACWLAALVLSPLVFDVYGMRPFDLVQSTVVRFLALLVWLAWIGRAGMWLLNRRPSLEGLRRRLRSPVGWAGLLVTGSWVLSTVVSSDPALSFWGGFYQAKGLLMAFGPLTFLFALLLDLRTAGQVRRLLWAVLIAGFGASLYGALQFTGEDLIAWSRHWNDGDVPRLSTTLGGPMFAGSYLMAVTLAGLALLTSEAQTLSRSSRLLLLGAGVVLAPAWGLQPFAGTAGLAALAVFCGARRVGGSVASGFALGTLAGAWSAVLFTFALTQSRGALLGLAGGGLLFAVLVAPRIGRKMPAVAALVLVAGLLGFTHQTPRQDQTPTDPRGLDRMTEVDDRSSAMRVMMWRGSLDVVRSEPARWLIGHGPETLRHTFERHYPAELRTYEGGVLIGHAHNAVLHTLAERGSLGLLGWIALLLAGFAGGFRALGRLNSARDTIVLVACSLGGGVAGATGLAYLFGETALAGPGFGMGLMAGVGLYALIAPRPVEPVSHRWLVAGLMAMLAAGTVEAQTGFEVTSTWLLAMVSAGALGALGLRGSTAADEAFPDVRFSLAALAAGGLAVSFGRMAAEQSLVLMVAWMAGVLLFAGWASERPAGRRWIGVGLGMASAVLMARMLPVLDPDMALAMWSGLGVLVVWIAGVLWQASARRRVALSAAGVGLLAVAFAPLPPVALPLLEASALAYRANLNAAEPAEGVRLFEQAFARDPQTRYALEAAGLIIRAAEADSVRSRRDSLFASSLGLAQAARQAAPLDPSIPRNMGAILASWAEHTQETGDRDQRFRQSLAYSDTARAMQPTHADVLVNRSRALDRLGLPDSAAAAYETATTVQPNDARSFSELASLYLTAGDTARAIATYRRSIDSGNADLALLFAYAGVFVSPAARAEAVARHAGEPRVLAMLYWRGGQCREARRYIADVVQAGRADFTFNQFAKHVSTECATQ
ncbi:MAG: O-antigen ligase family protein [Bacteroidota bacterium]